MSMMQQVRKCHININEHYNAGNLFSLFWLLVLFCFSAVISHKVQFVMQPPHQPALTSKFLTQ